MVLAVGLLGIGFAGCAKPIRHTDVAAAADMTTTASVVQTASARYSQPMPNRIFSSSQLAGRTLEVATTADIILRPGEVVLTFDDGPRAGKTPRILDALDRYGVKATFLMLGSAAKANPALAQEVARRGHTVGSHTYDHTDLTQLDRQAAIDEIARGEAAVAAALGPERLSPFFRFPYLSQTGYLRTTLLQGDMVVLDVDIDSKDYFKDTAEVVTTRTLERLDARGSGIILFHDIHQRTVDMLPGFLADLEARGYSVVRLVPRTSGVFGRSVITADAPVDASPTTQ
ncbi:Peptidoglycan/xylan/chitin deacetylase, PgdA/CDA1 family [Devosia lucknowensis]|uniref:Chitooligosaccharide deacetylase n=2 Tax=Devosia lucknowensis TaxID=1096929 RepID=A0A1Y6EZN1_9HYPH|nr:Peptidoglycan/xylan/chitin deacetylase, PgdA/CDA1 family [Devosia lucknowensis]